MKKKSKLKKAKAENFSKPIVKAIRKNYKLMTKLLDNLADLSLLLDVK